MINGDSCKYAHTTANLQKLAADAVKVGILVENSADSGEQRLGSLTLNAHRHR
jgi:hypothetical protein